MAKDTEHFLKNYYWPFYLFYWKGSTDRDQPILRLSSFSPSSLKPMWEAQAQSSVSTSSFVTAVFNNKYLKGRA